MEVRREEIAETCRRYGVERLDLFGSAARGQGGGFDPEKSDLDFVVSFAPRTPACLFDRYFGLKEDLEELLGRPVDLVMEGALAKTRTLPRVWQRAACSCMRPEARTPKALEDVRDAASFVLDVTEGKTLEDYSGDRLLRQAVERNFEIIGEAVGRLARNDPPMAARLSEYRRIVDFRNILIHGYDLVDDDLVWDTLKDKLPVVLLTEVEAQLDDLSGGEDRR